MTRELITEFYEALTELLPGYHIFLNNDGKKMRNPSRVEGQENEITCVEDALSTVGVAIVVCARMTSRDTKSSSAAWACSGKSRNTSAGRQSTARSSKYFFMIAA